LCNKSLSHNCEYIVTTHYILKFAILRIGALNIIDRIFNKRVIIGIHGLANKPPEKLLKKWWKMSIREGLATIGRKETPFTFRLVYWADFTHELPENPRIRDKESKLYLADPYTPGKPGSYDNFMLTGLKKSCLIN
jgi:hypothetical protein